MSKRSSQSIKKSILQALKSGQQHTYAQLERKVNTGFRSIIANCKELETYGAVIIKKQAKHDSNGKPYFEVGITSAGRKILSRL